MLDPDPAADRPAGLATARHAGRAAGDPARLETDSASSLPGSGPVDSSLAAARPTAVTSTPPDTRPDPTAPADRAEAQPAALAATRPAAPAAVGSGDSRDGTPRRTALDAAGPVGPTRPTALAAPGPVPLTTRCVRVLLSPWSRLSLLVVLLAAAGTTVLLFEPHRLLADGWPPKVNGAAAVVVFAVAYGVCTIAFVPRPLLNLAAGALFGSELGLGAALVGTVIGAGAAFGLGRVLGQDALRPLLRARWLKAADGQLSRHGFRSMLAARLFPGIPFWAANYCAAVSRMGWTPFLLATALGSIPNTAAYVVAGARASTPTSPVFLIAMGFIAVTGLAGAVVAWCKRHRLRGR